MIVTKNFVFLHLHKSGGTFINQALLNYFPDALQIGYHLPVSELPECYSHLPLLGVVRNPWDYYVSWYSFQLTLKQPTFVWRVFSEDGRLNFSQTVERMLVAGEDEVTLNRLRELAPETFLNRNVNLTKHCLPYLKGQSFGWYTFLFRRMYDDFPVHFLKIENLRSEFYAFLRSKVEITPELHSFIFESPKINATPHDDYRAYYSDRLARLLQEREAAIVERFGYAF